MKMPLKQMLVIIILLAFLAGVVSGHSFRSKQFFPEHRAIRGRFKNAQLVKFNESEREAFTQAFFMCNSTDKDCLKKVKIFKTHAKNRKGYGLFRDLRFPPINKERLNTITQRLKKFNNATLHIRGGGIIVKIEYEKATPELYNEISLINKELDGNVLLHLI